jgi:integrase
MKNYSPKIAAKLQVRPQVIHGLSRHKNHEMAEKKISSVGTERNHVSALTVFAKWLIKDSKKHLKNAKSTDANRYLTERSKVVRQKTLDMDRQALNMNMNFQTDIKFKLSEVKTPVENLAYSQFELNYLISRAPDNLRLSIQLSSNAGLRSMEILSLSPPFCLSQSVRSWHINRFAGRSNDVSFIVHGKGGLHREIRLSPELAEHVKKLTRPVPVIVSNRETHLTSHFDLLGGHYFCNRFSIFSKNELGFSHGAHGLRHTFAQKRLLELMCLGHDTDNAIKILAQEMGHFAITNTLTYLRERFTV